MWNAKHYTIWDFWTAALWRSFPPQVQTSQIVFTPLLFFLQVAMIFFKNKWIATAWWILAAHYNKMLFMSLLLLLFVRGYNQKNMAHQIQCYTIENWHWCAVDNQPFGRTPKKISFPGQVTHQFRKPTDISFGSADNLMRRHCASMSKQNMWTNDAWQMFTATRLPKIWNALHNQPFVSWKQFYVHC